MRHRSVAPHTPMCRPSWWATSLEEWELTGGDVQDALAWAKEHAGQDRTWILHVAGPS